MKSRPVGAGSFDRLRINSNPAKNGGIALGLNAAVVYPPPAGAQACGPWIRRAGNRKLENAVLTGS